VSHEKKKKAFLLFGLTLRFGLDRAEETDEHLDSSQPVVNILLASFSTDDHDDDDDTSETHVRWREIQPSLPLSSDDQ
jgi:hypothetical protein